MSVMINAYLRTYPAMVPALKEQQSAETTCASAVMMTLTVNITPATSETAMANVSQGIHHVTRLVSLDTISATTSMAMTINSAMKDA